MLRPNLKIKENCYAIVSVPPMLGNLDSLVPCPSQGWEEGVSSPWVYTLDSPPGKRSGTQLRTRS